jgi:acetolactate synthase regulatory subunit
MNTSIRSALSALALASLTLTGCFEAVTVETVQPGAELAVGQSHSIELRALELQVRDFGQILSLQDLRNLPRETLDEVWLLDLDMTPLVRNTLLFLRDAPSESLGSQAARNMQNLLRLSANDVDFARTQLESLLGLSGSIGIPAAQAIADLLQLQRTEPLVPINVAADALVAGLIASHPASRFRPGPVDAAHPEGLWPVAPGYVPITLGDVVGNFEDLTERFGAAPTESGFIHPGFIEAARGFTVVEDQFKMTVRVNANALPYKGIDLTNASQASVNSLGAQIEQLFDTTDPDWLVIEGLVARPTIEALTIKVVESPEFFLPGDSRNPLPTGNGAVWDQPPWVVERMIGEMMRTTVGQLSPACTTYEIGAQTTVFESCIDATGWVTFETFNDLGEAPAPAYLWDVELDLAQVRLHDGEIAEGEAEVSFTIEDVSLGVDAIKMVEEIKLNIARDPRTLRELAQAANQTTRGAADVFYVRVESGENAGDWLWFVEPSDIPRGDDGQRVRHYGYVSPGFFADAALIEPLGQRVVVEGDSEHLKVRVQPGQRLFVQDDVGRTYQLDVVGKASERRVELAVRRVR